MNREERIANQRLVQGFARLQPKAFAIACGIVAAGILFGLTVVVVIKGPVEPDVEVGQHLGLLTNYFPGYDVTWVGAFVGLVWGFIAGFVPGYLVAGAMNFHHEFYVRLIERAFCACSLGVW